MTAQPANQLMQLDGGFAAAADQPNRYTNEGSPEEMN